MRFFPIIRRERPAPAWQVSSRLAELGLGVPGGGAGRYTHQLF